MQPNMRQIMPGNLVKLSFNHDPTDWHLTPSEAVWAEPLDVSGTYRVMNTPYFIKGISFRDIIGGKSMRDLGIIEFSGVVIERSGHSTYRLAVLPGQLSFAVSWHLLAELGCSYEAIRALDTSMGVRDLFAVDVPPETDIYEVYEILTRGEQRGVWMFEKGFVGHKLRASGLF